jgi:hypothetical protein
MPDHGRASGVDTMGAGEIYMVLPQISGEAKKMETRMDTKKIYEGVERVFNISTDVSERCEHCEQMAGGSLFAESIYHYIEDHGYRLLHVGEETTRDTDGTPWNMTVAVLGRKYRRPLVAI